MDFFKPDQPAATTEESDGVLVNAATATAATDQSQTTPQQNSTDDFLSANNSSTQQQQQPQSTSKPIAMGMGSLGTANPYEQTSTTNDNTDIFAGLPGSNDADAKDDNEANDELKDNVEKTDDEPTFLSVWKEQRVDELQQRRDAEKQAKQKSLDEARVELEQFEADRAARIVSKQKENRVKEGELREDLQSTFEHGTIWEQVGKMVNLQETKNKNDPTDSDRMRVLLIHLKNLKNK